MSDRNIALLVQKARAVCKEWLDKQYSGGHVPAHMIRELSDAIYEYGRSTGSQVDRIIPPKKEAWGDYQSAVCGKPTKSEKPCPRKYTLIPYTAEDGVERIPDGCLWHMTAYPPQQEEKVK